MLRHRILDKLPNAVCTRIVDWYWPRREPEFALLPEFCGGAPVAIDVGGWWGPWTSAMAKVADHVHTFEPQPRLAAILRNRMPDHVTVHEVALSDTAGTTDLWLPADQPGLDSVASIRDDRTSAELEREGTVTTHRVETRTLDSYGFEGVQFLKIDVEGHEASLLAGARDLLVGSRPHTVIEIEQRHHAEPIDSIFETFLALDYTGWFSRNGRWCELASFDLERDQLAHTDDVNAKDYINNFFFARAGSAPSPR